MREAMESGMWSYEHQTLISELIHGANLASQLKTNLSSASSLPETRELLIHGIINSYEKALLILNWRGTVTCQPHQPHVPVAAGGAAGCVPESPLSSVNGSPGSDEFDKGTAVRVQCDYRDASKKRKMLPKWTDQVRICPDTGLEGPHDDGCSWRKYGQKDILGAKYPRSYYRCTYRNTQNCWATKQVQRSDDDATVFEITYRGKHTCVYGGGPSTPASASAKKQDPKQVICNDPQQDQSRQDPLTRFRAGLRVETEDLDGSNISETPPGPFAFSSSFKILDSENYSSPGLASHMGIHAGHISSPFLSPTTSESNYFSMCPCPMSEFEQIHKKHQSESDLTEIISATNSSTNSPILDLDFPFDTVGIDPNNFPFDPTVFLP